MAGEAESSVPGALEDTIGSDEEPAPIDTGHRNYDEIMEDTTESAHFLASTKHVPGRKKALLESLMM